MPVKAKPRNDGEVTRMRLLGAACSVFSAKGFRDATVQEICRQAEVNPALISYHFGDKASFYEAVWRHCVKRARQHYPVDGGAGSMPRWSTSSILPWQASLQCGSKSTCANPN
ncbi:MAG: TetR/AcrR family transcriptional regulator [Verrucomicrobiae bacterium]|nr:TetR/AcrR family transcriptional regulator [Verrucomicrobiae bacterium]